MLKTETNYKKDTTYTFLLLLHLVANNILLLFWPLNNMFFTGLDILAL